MLFMVHHCEFHFYGFFIVNSVLVEKVKIDMLN
jgi:hypothetical protein